MSTLFWRSKATFVPTIVIFLLGISPLWILAEESIKHPSFQEKSYEFKQMKQTSLIFLGDSLTDYHNWHHFGSHHNAGRQANSTEDVLSRIHPVLEKKPRTVVLMIGINDLLSDRPLERVKRNYSQILDALSDIKELVVLSTLPVTDIYQGDQINRDVTALNIFLKNEAKKRHLHYLDLYASFVGDHSELQREYTLDGVHLNRKGYLLWESILQKAFPSGFSK